ncbi:ATP synthase alpha/beta family, nucleotide-binding domain protein, partial [Vibrio parahaemolyticus VP2007-007]
RHPTDQPWSAQKRRSLRLLSLNISEIKASAFCC